MTGLKNGRGGVWRRWWGAVEEPAVGSHHRDDGLVAAHQAARYGDAERLLIAAVRRAERQTHRLGELAIVLGRLADLYRTQGRYEEAERTYRRAIGICEAQAPATLARMLNGLALVYRAQGLYADAEPLSRRAVETAEREHGVDHAITAAAVRNLMTIYLAQRRYHEAGPLFRRVVALKERALGPRHPALAGSMSAFAAFLRQTRADDEAALWEERVRAIRTGARPNGRH